MKHTGVALALGLMGLLLIVLLLGWFDAGQVELRAEKTQLTLEQTRELAPLWLAVKRVLVAALGVAGGSLATLLAVAAIVALLSMPNLLRATWVRSWLVKPNSHALYPALAEPDGQGHIRVIAPVNERLSQPIAALTGGNVERLGGAGQVVKQLTNPKADEFALTEPEPLPEFTPDQVIRPDPQNRPDVLVVGQKGAGKTNVLRWLIEAHRQALPDAEFMIMSPIGSNWGLPETISEPDDIQKAILALRQEMKERDEAMRLAGVRDIHRWPDAPRPVVIVVDEAEAVADMIKLESAAKAREFAGNLRILVNTGRNFRMLIIQGTQTARADVMDPAFLHNAGTTIMMKMDAATAARFNQYDPKIIAGLPTLAPGRGYCPQAGGYLNFPLVSELRPPRMSRIYRVPLQLPADAEADGLGADDMPDTIDGSGTVLEPQNGRVYASEAPLPAGTVPVPALRIDRRRPTPVEAANMRAHYARTGSKTSVCMVFYGYKNGDCWDWVEQALRGEM